jgi:ABC-2 type transport system permease protein
MTDTAAMLRRVLTHMLRNPFVTLLTILGTPIILLLLMYNLFGGAVESGGTARLSTAYIDYITPGIILITAIYGTGTAALRVNSDMAQGIIARFRSMSISRASVLQGHVFGSAIATLISISVIIGLAFLMGFQPTANLLEWIAALALIFLYVMAIMWLAVGIGVASKSLEAANSVLYLLYILPFFSSAFVPTALMTPVVALIAENQPFTPIIDTLRALLIGTPSGDRAGIAVAWCIGFMVVGYLLARTAYNRNSNR